MGRGKFDRVETLTEPITHLQKHANVEQSPVREYSRKYDVILSREVEASMSMTRPNAESILNRSGG